MGARTAEMPHERDEAAYSGNMSRNVRIFLDKYQFAEPLLKLAWLLLVTGPARRSLMTDGEASAQRDRPG